MKGNIIRLPIEVSNRHIHLTKEVYEELFDEEPKKVKLLSQPHCTLLSQRLNIYCPQQKEEIENVALLYPFRAYNQVEVSYTDAKRLFNESRGVPKRVISGDISGAFDIVVENPKNGKRKVLNHSCILAKAHIHIPFSYSKKYAIEDRKSYLLTYNNRSISVVAKVREDYYPVVHIDIDEAKELEVSREVKIEKKECNGVVTQLNYRGVIELVCEDEVKEEK